MITWKQISYFTPSEFACKCGRPNCDAVAISMDLVFMLDLARLGSKTSFRISSGSRCEYWNHKKGGTKNSSHLSGLAADIKARTFRKKFKILTNLIYIGFIRFGVYKWGIHVDLDESKRRAIWGI